MTCPNCNKELTVVTRQGMEFETCTNCGGFWLTTEEMDKALGRSIAKKTANTKNVRMQAPAISAVVAETDTSIGEDYTTYYNYKFHGCNGRPRNPRWALKLSTSYAATS